MKGRWMPFSGFLLCMLLNVASIYMMLPGGPQWEDRYNVVGRCATAIADALANQVGLPQPGVASAGTDRWRLSGGMYVLLYALLTTVFAASFWRRTSVRARRSAFSDFALLALQLGIAAAAAPRLLYLLAAELAFILPTRTAMGWMFALLVAYAVQRVDVLYARASSDRRFQYEFATVAMDCVFYLLTFGVALLATMERRARARLVASHNELLATQALLANAVRSSERLRISRDLHDSIGHHLTALNLHIDLAMRRLQGDQRDSLRTPRELSQALLSNVRHVVSAEREDSAIDLGESLAILCHGIPSPIVRLHVDKTVRIESPALAHALFSCVQEGLSNAVRHARAQRLDVSLRQQDEQILVVIRDDGLGNRGRPEGNGLRGMRERLAPFGGQLTTGNRPEGGFSLEISISLRSNFR